jgi:gliding motility-associated-like protein
MKYISFYKQPNKFKYSLFLTKLLLMQKKNINSKLIQGLILSFLLIPAIYIGQISVNNTSMTVEQYVQNVLLGGGVSISNVQYNGGPANINNNQVGSFNDPNSNIGLGSGLIMGSGDVQMAAQQNTGTGASLGGTGNPGTDTDLQSITPNQIYDECVIEFDFIPDGDTISFNYVFASEEYPDFVCGTVNDAFGFFITGTDPNGGTYNAQNIALIPNPNNPSLYTTTAVSINTVNPGVAGLFGMAFNCSSIDPNWASYNVFYQGNTSNNYEYNGSTTVLVAKAHVVCGETYHIKLAIGDGGDAAFDSGVFLEEGSFSSSGVSIETGINNGSALSSLDTLLYEGCNNAYFVFSRIDTNVDFTIQFDVSGTAQNGIDFPTIPDSLVMPIGTQSDTLFIYPNVDNLLEPTETVIIYIYYISCGSQLDTISATLYINDYTPLSLVLPDSVNICPEIDGSYFLEGAWGGGIDPYNFLWSNGSTDTNSITVSPYSTQDYSLTISDGCGTPIIDTTTVWVQCPLEQVNIFTPDGDGINDYFIPINLEDYPDPTLEVYNRWGKIVYKMEHYQNDWDGTHYKSGNDLNEGVYYYIVIPNSSKYEYTEHKKDEIKRTMAGYVHLVRK